MVCRMHQFLAGAHAPFFLLVWAFRMYFVLNKKLYKKLGEISHFLHHHHAALEPVTVGFEQEAFTTNEGSKLSFALEISGPGFGSVPSPGGIQGGFDPQRDLGLVLVDGSPIALCESRMYNSSNKQCCLRETVGACIHIVSTTVFMGEIPCITTVIVTFLEATYNIYSYQHSYHDIVNNFIPINFR